MLKSLCDSYPVPPVGIGLAALLRLSFLQPSVGERVLVEAVGPKRACATALIKVPAWLAPDVPSRGGRRRQKISSRLRSLNLREIDPKQ